MDKRLEKTMAWVNNIVAHAIEAEKHSNKKANKVKKD